MTGGVASSTNTRLADKDTALQIVQAATSALDAMGRAGIVLNPVEVAFVQALDWSKLQSELVNAYNQGKTPQVKIVAGPPGVSAPASDNGTVTITLSGNVGVGGD